jgi:cardiolipin synthase
VVGIIFFLIFGTIPFYIKNARETNKYQAKLISYEKYDFTNEFLKKHDKFSNFKFNFENMRSPIYKNNEVKKIINNNSNILKQYLKLIAQAKKTICIQTYKIDDGCFFLTIAKALIDKTKAGVKIILIYDWFGSGSKINYRVIEKMKNAGIDVVVFNPKGRIPYKSLSNFRNHQKCLIIDNEVCLYGSANLADEHILVNTTRIMYSDTMYILQGEIVNSISINFYSSYLTLTNANKKKISNTIKMVNLLKPIPASGSLPLQLTTGMPVTQINNIRSNFLLAIQEARKSIKFIYPYFSPTEDILAALRIAAIKGVQIQIVVPTKNNESIFTCSLNRHTYGKLISYSNVKIYEHTTFIHTKMLIVDDEFCFFGSSNLDNRSLKLNFENSLCCIDTKLAKQLNEVFEEKITESKIITIEF